VSEPLAVALVGAGRMGQMHLRACRIARRVRLVAVVDPVPEARRRVEESHGVPAVASLDELAAVGGVEGVVIAAPTDLHLELVGRCARAGLPVLCEKPCGLTPQETREAARAAERAGVVLQVGYYRRFVPGLVSLRARIASGERGSVSLVALHQWDEQPPGAAFERRSGSIVVDMGVHEFDQVRWLTGQEVEDVVAVRGRAGDDGTVAALLRLSGGALAVVTLGRRFPVPDSCWVEVVATNGYERLPFIWGAEGDAVMLGAVAAELDAFAARVRGEHVEVPGGAEAVAALAVAQRVDAALDGV
jgi:myo-inositol 2-dehydrogenase / D-chiro-inositol 1-dehydrogenase